MAAVTGPGYVTSPQPSPPVRRRWLPVAVVVGWSVLLAAGVFWSARTDPPTVAEQRDIGQAVPEVRRATGAVLAAAQDKRWVVRLGELRIEKCSVSPVWAGQIASRDVTVYVPEGDARAALDRIAAGLPEGYQASVLAMRGGTRLSLYADAGEFVAIDAEARSVDQVLTVRVDSGCRPATGRFERADPEPGAIPATLAEVLSRVRPAEEPGRDEAQEPGQGEAQGPSAAPVDGGTMAVSCPDGGIAATFVRDGGPGDPDDGPRGVPEGTTPVWAGAGGWAYRIGSDSVVITGHEGRLRVSLTTACRAG